MTGVQTCALPIYTRGEWIWLRCRGQLLKDSQGWPDLFAGMITNLGKVNRTDHMTGLYNRFAFEGNIKKYLVDYKDLRSMDAVSYTHLDVYKRQPGSGMAFLDLIQEGNM